MEIVHLITMEMGKSYSGGGQVQKPSQALNLQRLGGCAFSNRDTWVFHVDLLIMESIDLKCMSNSQSS